MDRSALVLIPLLVACGPELDVAEATGRFEESGLDGDDERTPVVPACELAWTQSFADSRLHGFALTEAGDGVAVLELDASGGDVVLARWSPDGQPLTTHPIPLEPDEHVHGLAVDPVGRAFVLGQSSSSAWVRAYLDDGTLAWTRPLPVAEGDVLAHWGSASVSSNGDLLVSAVAGSASASPQSRAWVARLDGEGGELLWVFDRQLPEEGEPDVYDTFAMAGVPEVVETSSGDILALADVYPFGCLDFCGSNYLAIRLTAGGSYSGFATFERCATELVPGHDARFETGSCDPTWLLHRAPLTGSTEWFVEAESWLGEVHDLVPATGGSLLVATGEDARWSIGTIDGAGQVERRCQGQVDGVDRVWVGARVAGDATFVALSTWSAPDQLSTTLARVVLPD